MLGIDLSITGLAARGGGGAFSPASLFASGEAGAWYDPSDLSTLWQDTGGTVPVTADGQSVARIDDKSGNGHHITQATSSLRPVYKTDGSLHWLLFDSVDDYYTLPSSGLDIFRNVSGASLFAGYEYSSLITTSWLIYASINGGTGSRCAMGNFSNSFVAGGRRLDADTFDSVTTTQNTTASVASGLFDYADSRLELRRNGALAASEDAFQTNGNTSDTSSDVIAIGADANAGGEFGGKLFGAILLGDLASSEEVADTEEYLADKSGVTL